ncbi:MAG: sodium:solute symporter family protein [Bacillota bacterium]
MDISSYPHANMVLIGIIIYMLAMLAIGWWSSKRIKDSTDYIVAGRRLSLFLTTGTLFATWFCAGTLMGATAQSYLFGNQGVIFDPWGAAVCLILTGLFFARLMRRGGYLTLVDFFELRYGKKMGILASIVLVIAEIGWVGAQLVAFGTILQIFTGLPLGWGILISCAVLIIYTYLGGMWSVTLTDVVQMFILVAGVVVILPAVVTQIGGWNYLFSHAGNWAELPSFSMVPTAEEGYLWYFGIPGWFYYIGAWLALGFGSIPAQDLMQRVLSAKNEKVASYSSYIAGAMYLVVGMIPVILGIAMFEINADLTIPQTEMILPWLAVNFLPPILTVVFVAALVAALMSSSDSALLAAASIIGYNGLRYVKPNAGSEMTLKVTRACVPIVAVVSLLLALYAETIYMLVVIAWSVILVGLFAPYAAGYFWKKCNQTGAIAALFSGFISWLGFIFFYMPLAKDANIGIIEEGVVYMEWAIWDAVYIGSVPAFFISIVVMVVVSVFTAKADPAKPLIDMDGNPMKLINWTGFKFNKSA